MSPPAGEATAPVLAIDVGGTKVQAAVVEADGTLSRHRTVPADWSDQGAAMVRQILSLAKSAVRARPDIVAAGVGATGLFSPEGRVVAARPGRERWLGVPLAATLSQALGMPARAANDSQAMALGEWRYGSGRGSRVLLGVSLGTGLGAGLVEQGRLFDGAFGGAGEIGHLTLDMFGRLCNCGRLGCVEAYIAGPAIAARYAERSGIALAPPAILDRADAGEPEAQRLLEDVVAELGCALASLVAVLNPDRISLGGGLGGRLASRLPALAQAVRRSRLTPEGLAIVGAALGVEAPLYGAAALARAAVGA